MSLSDIASKLEIIKLADDNIVKKLKVGEGMRDPPRLEVPQTQHHDVLIRRKSVADPNKNAAEMYKKMATEHGFTMNRIP